MLNIRQSRFRETLAAQSLNAALITNLTHVRYLSGFTGSAGMLLFLPASQHFFSDGRYLTQAHAQVKNFQIHIANASHNLAGKGLLGLAQEQGLIGDAMEIGYEEDHVVVSQLRRWQAMLPKTKWKGTSNLVENLAMVKDADELEALQKAISITDEVFTELLNDIHPGVLERDVAARLTFLIRTKGGEADAFESIVASGWRSALPHARPSEKPIGESEFVVLDFGARYGGYHADMTRTICVGPVTDRHHEIYEIVKESQLAGIAATRDGVIASEVDKACRDHITAKGYGEQFTHSTGHGIGLEIHTAPRLSQTSDTILRKDMVVTIEPGIYIEGWGGVRIEDDVLVGIDSSTPFNQSDKNLIILN